MEIQAGPRDGSHSDGAQITVLARSDHRWPPGLSTVDVEPGKLWLRGREGCLQRPRRIAIVGSRAPTPYGLSEARRFGRAFARHGIIVVSGLARGIDSAAHEGALEGAEGSPHGSTIAVLGCGVDNPWPGGPLPERIARAGLLVSEYAPGVRPRRHHFPLRNRLIAALSDAVLVVEAAHASGSLITARWAADQGQDVFALPGRIDHPMARGTLRLMREGATPVDSPEMLIEDLYGHQAGDPPDTAGTPESQGHADEHLTPLVTALRGETLTAAELAEQTGRDLGETLAHLTTLELDGVVRRCPGGLYAIN